MKYTLLIYNDPNWRDGFSEEEARAIYGEYVALNEDSRCLGGEQLQPEETATIVKVQNGDTLTTDGPFADTKEAFAGYYLFEAGDLDEAIGLAARIPAARTGGAVEVRPVVER